jgi:hypothetical protein
MLPALDGGFDVRLLRSFRTTAQQENQFSIGLRVVDAEPRAQIDSEFPNARMTEPAVAGVVSCQAVNPTQDGDPYPRVLETVEPVLKRIPAIGSQVVSNVHVQYSLLSE